MKTLFRLATLSLAFCCGCGSSGRTDLVPDSPHADYRDDPLWYNSPLLVAPGNSPSSSRERKSITQQKKQLAEERAALEIEKRKIADAKPKTLDVKTPRRPGATSPDTPNNKK